MTVTQRMCVAVSPWTLVVMVWLDWNEKREEKQIFNDISPSTQIEDDYSKAAEKMTELEILNARNLPQFPPRKTSILSLEEEEEPFKDHHKLKLGIIWGMSLLCGLCSEQALDQSKNPPCSLTRRLTSPVEIVSILLTSPLPALFTLCPLFISLCVSPQSHSNHSTRTSLVLSICHLLSILPSVLVELMDTANNLAIMMVLKFSLASIHIIFEPLIILYMRPALLAALRTVWTRQRI